MLLLDSELAPAAHAQGQPDNGACVPDPVGSTGPASCIFRFTDTPVVEDPGATGSSRMIEVDPVANRVYIAYGLAVAAYDANRPGYPLLYNATLQGASNSLDAMAVNTKTGDLYVAERHNSTTTYLYTMDEDGSVSSLNVTVPYWSSGAPRAPVPNGLQVDSERGLVYISTTYYGIVVANMTAEPPAVVQYGWTSNANLPGWRSTFHAWQLSSMAVNTTAPAPVAYATTVYWDNSASQYKVGLNTLRFGSGGTFSPDYATLDSIVLYNGTSAPPSQYLAAGRHLWADDMALDDRNDKLFVLWVNRTLAWYDLANRTSGAAGLPTYGGNLAGISGANRNLVLDEGRGILYLVSGTSVGAYRTSDGVRLAVLDRPGPSGHTAAIDSLGIAAAAPDGMDAGSLDTGIVYALGQYGPLLTVIDPRPESLPERLVREVAYGGEVVIPNGTYRHVYLTTGEKAMTIRSESGKPGGVVFTGASHIIVKHSNVAIKGIVFKDIACHDKIASVHRHNGYLPEYVINVAPHRSHDRNITIADNVFDNTCYGGVLSGGFNSQTRQGSGSARDVAIANNTFRDIGYNARHYDGVPDEPRNAIRTGVHSRSVEMRDSAISTNVFDRVAGVAVDVRQARNLVVADNTFADIPLSAVWVRGGSAGIEVRNNTMTNASYAPSHNFLRGVESGRSLTQEAAILVVPDDGNRLADTRNVNATGNVISQSGGAFSVCGTACEAHGSGYSQMWGPGVNYNVGPGGLDIRFNWNTVYMSSSDDGDRLVENGVRGALDARYNYYPGYEPAAGLFKAGQAAGSVLYEPLFTLAPDDPTAPSVLRVTSGNLSTGYVAGQSIDIMVVFTKPVAIAGTPILTVHAGETDRNLAMTGHDASVLTFRYTVADGDSSAALEYTNTTSLAFGGGGGGGTITDANTGAPADLTLPALGSGGSLSSKMLAIGTPDTDAPAVVRVTSGSPNGTYAINERIEVQVAFNETVRVRTAGGTPTLMLETGATDRPAVYVRGDNTDTLVFEYYPTYGDTSTNLDYVDRDALRLNGGTITDVVRNAANRTLPEPGSPGSLADSSMIEVMVPELVGNGACPGLAGCSYSVTGVFALPESGTGAGLAAMDATAGLLYVASPGSPSSVSILNASDGFSEVRTQAIGGSDAYIFAVAANPRDGTAYVLAHDTNGTDDWPSYWHQKGAWGEIDDEVFVQTINGAAGGLLGGKTVLNITGQDGATATSPRPDDALAVDADGRMLYVATLDGIVTVPIGAGGALAGQANPLNANATAEQGTRISAMAVDAAGRIAYAAAAYALPPDGVDGTLDMAYGLLALNFTGAGGAFTPSYERAGSLVVSENPSVSSSAALPFAAGDMALDADAGRLYVNWYNGTISSYAASPASPSPSFVRHFAEPEWDVVDIELDAASGVLYAVTMPDDGRRLLGLVAYNASTGAIASRTDVPAGGALSLYGRAGSAVVAGAAEHGLEFGPVHMVPGFGATGYTVDPKPPSIPELLVDRAAHGSTVVVPDGTYVDVDLSLGEKQLSIRSASGQAGGVVFTGASHLLVRDGDSAVEGLSFRNIECTVYDYVVEVSAWRSVDSDVAIRNNEISSTCPGGLDIGGAADGRVERVMVEGNDFGGIGTYGSASPAAPRAAIHTGQSESSVQVRDAVLSSNTISSTSGTGIEIGQGRNVTVSANDIQNTPGSAIVVGGGSVGVAITGNTIAMANTEPGFDYLSGVSGSRAAPYEAAILVKPGDGGALGPTDNVFAGGNTISSSMGAFSVCGDVCEIRGDAYNVPWGPGAANHAIGLPGGQDIRFSDNTIHENNTGPLVRNDAGGVLDARYNMYPGYAPNASRFAPPDRVAWGVDPTAASAGAVFSGPNAVTIAYTGPLGAPAGHEGPVYGMVAGPGGFAANATAVDGLGTATHTVTFDGPGASSMQNGSIAVNVDLEGVGADYTRYAFADDSIPVKPRLEAVVVQPGQPPVVIEPDSRIESVTGNESAAIRAPSGTPSLQNLTVAVTNLAAIVFAPSTAITSAGTSAAYGGAIGVANATDARQEAAVAALAALDIANASARIGTVVEIGNASADIALDRPARVLLGDQPARAQVFHMDSANGVTEILPCGTDPDTAGWLAANRGTVPFCYTTEGSDGDRADYTIYTYRLSAFFTVGEAPADPAKPRLEAVVVQPGQPPVVIEPDSRIESVTGNESAAIRAPSGTPRLQNLTVAVTNLAAIVFAPSTAITSAGTSAAYGGAIGVANATDARQEAAVAALAALDIANASARIGTVVEIGNASADIALDRPARVLLGDQPARAQVYHMNSANGVTEILPCGTDPDPAGWLAANRGTVPFCYTAEGSGDGDRADYTIYTYRLSAFFTVGEAPADPGTTDPGTTDPGTTDPGTTDPGTTDPGTTDPGTTDPGANRTLTNSTTGMLTATIIVPSPTDPRVVQPPTVAPSGQFFGAGGAGGGGGGGGGGGQLAPAGSGAVTLYAASWDCNEGTIQITVNSGIRPDITILSSEGTIVAQRGDGPHPAGRAVYEAPLPGDPIISIRAMLAEGRAVSMASEAVRTGGQCTGEAVFEAYGASAAARPPQPDDRPPAAERSGAQPSDVQDRPSADQPTPEPPSDALPGEPDAPGEIAIPEPPPEPPADDRPPGAGDRDQAEPPTAEAPPAEEDAAPAEDEDDDTGGCLIATAAHGTEIAPQVQSLREVRDGTLLTTESGRAFMAAFGAAYYSFSPQVADLEREHPALRHAVAALAAPMLYALSVVGMADPGSEASVAAYGALAIALVAGMYVAAPAAGAWYAVLLGRARGGRSAAAADATAS